MADKALRDISSRRVFAPYFRARWQNMQNIINDSVFYSEAPYPWLTYYQTYIRQWAQWAQGFVQALHRGDFFSTGMGYTVCDIMTRECMSGGYRISSKNKEAQDYMTDYGRKFDFTTKFNKMFFFANALGNSVLTLHPKDGDIVPGIIPVNRIVMTVCEGNEITSALLYRRFVTGKDTVYYAREYRQKLNGKGYYRVEICSQGGTVLSPSWGGTPLKKIPQDIEEAFREVYGNIEVNTWYTLPECLHSLGLYNVRNKPVAVAVADLPGYSDSTLHTALDVLYSIDYNYTQQQLDQYWGRTRVLVPERLQAINLGARNRVVDGVSYEEALTPPLDDDIYSKVPDSGSVDGKPIEPMFIQPDARGEMHKYIRDADLELLASKVGLSSATLANHLAYNATKTATQVHAEEDTTETTVNNKRQLATDDAINPWLQDIAAFYGYSDEVTLVWNKSSVNSQRQNEELLADYNAGLITKREYLKRRWRDLSDEEVDKWVADLEEAEAKRDARDGAMFDGGLGL